MPPFPRSAAAAVFPLLLLAFSHGVTSPAQGQDAGAIPPPAPPKVKLGPRPLPGTAKPKAIEVPEIPFGEVPADAAASASARIPTFGPQSAAPVPIVPAKPAFVPRAQAARLAAEEAGPERARILFIHRAGTIKLPPAPTEAVVSEAGTPQHPAAAPGPAALPEGKIRIIPREVVSANPLPAAP